MIALCVNPGSRIEHWVTGDNNGAVNFSENPADARLFVDAAAASAYASGKNVFGAVQVTVSGKKRYGARTNND